MVEALLVTAAIAIALAMVLRLLLPARREAPTAQPTAGPPPTLAKKPPRGPGPPGSGTRDPRRPRPQLGSGAAALPIPLAKRTPTRVVGRRPS